MVFQLFFECLDVPESIDNGVVIGLPCTISTRRDGIDGFSVLLNYEELNAYVVAQLGVASADLTHITLGDEKNVL